jgi:hypothetical protein
MAWKTLSDYYKQNFEKNRAFLWQRYPHLFHSLGDLQEVLPFIQIMERDGSIRAIQIRQDNRTRMILPPDYSPELLDQQRQSIQEAFQNKHRLIILSGIGAGHSLISLSERLQLYAHSAALVCEPRVENWAAFLALFPAQEILQSPRLYLFGGSEAAEQLTHFTRREYLYLLGVQQTAYLLGTFPAEEKETTAYITQAKAIASALQQSCMQFNETATQFQAAIQQPLTDTPKSVWCCMHRDAYVHYPIAEALLKGFAGHGLQTILEAYDNEFPTPFRIAGRFHELKPELIVSLNTHTNALLEDIGLHPDLVRNMRRTKLSWLVDNIRFFADEPEMIEPDPQEFTFYIERTFQPWAEKISSRAIFMPIAATFTQPGQPRQDFICPISYVGSLPAVSSYLNRLSPAVVELLQKTEQEKRKEYEKSFIQCFTDLNPTEPQVAEVVGQAREFCVTTSKNFTSGRAMLEYFLYNTSTFFKRREIVSALLPLGLFVYGPEAWKDVLPMKYRMNYRGFVSWNDLADVYASSRINLNIHSHQCPTCLNVRDFDVPMAGGLVLGDWVEDMERGFLKPGEEIHAFNSLADAVEKASWLLDNPDDALAAAQKGQQRVMKEHTCTHRVRRIMEIITAKQD